MVPPGWGGSEQGRSALAVRRSKPKQPSWDKTFGSGLLHQFLILNRNLRLYLYAAKDRTVLFKELMLAEAAARVGRAAMKTLLPTRFG